MHRNIKYFISFAILIVAALLVFAGCSATTVDNDADGRYNNSPRYGNGGMMGPGHMWGGGRYSQTSSDETINIDQAAEKVESYIRSYSNDLELVEIMEFDLNFYAEIEEESTGVHAMELLVDKYTGRVYPEMGPNMMWNTKYGMHSYRPGDDVSNDMSISPRYAQQLAQEYLDDYMPRITIGEAETFYGYYTMHTLKDGDIEGMLSVNGYNGSVWYHHWHGPFIVMKEFHEEHEG